MTTETEAGVTYQIEPIVDAMREAEPLIRAHIPEIDPPLGHDIHLEPGLYGDLESAGNLHCFVARCRGVMIGYCVAIHDRSHQHMGERHAHIDCVYMDPDHRWGMLAVRFMDWVDQELAGFGCHQVFHS